MHPPGRDPALAQQREEHGVVLGVGVVGEEHDQWAVGIEKRGPLAVEEKLVEAIESSSRLRVTDQIDTPEHVVQYVTCREIIQQDPLPQIPVEGLDIAADPGEITRDIRHQVEGVGDALHSFGVTDDVHPLSRMRPMRSVIAAASRSRRSMTTASSGSLSMAS